MAVKRRVRAHSDRELDPVWDWITDAEFSTAEVVWDRGARTLVVPITNVCHEPDFPARKPAGRGILSDYFYEPCFRATLTVHGVRSMEPEPHELIEPGWINTIEWYADRNVLAVESITDSPFDVEADRFDVEIVATDEIDHWHKALYGRFWAWQGRGPQLQNEPHT
jgi:hypothetical protein